MENWIEQLLPIIEEYKDGSNEPLDGDDAEKFITLCENNGSVYSQNGFIEAFNFDEIDVDNSFLFITNHY